MRKLLVSSVATAAMIMAIPASAGAWTYGLSGSGECQTDGSYKITWKVDNSSEKQALTITDSSNTTVVPVGSKVDAYGKKSYYQVADGTKANSFSLTLKGNWPSDQNARTRTSTVKLEKACDQPVTPTPVEPTTNVLGTQVVTTPVGAVSTGEATQRLNVAAIAGLIGSAVVLAFGLFRYRQSR